MERKEEKGEGAGEKGKRGRTKEEKGEDKGPGERGWKGYR